VTEESSRDTLETGKKMVKGHTNLQMEINTLESLKRARCMVSLYLSMLRIRRRDTGSGKMVKEFRGSALRIIYKLAAPQSRICHTIKRGIEMVIYSSSFTFIY
jgi:hypothetical protein